MTLCVDLMVLYLAQTRIVVVVVVVVLRMTTTKVDPLFFRAQP